MIKERNQNLVAGDIVRLRLFSRSSNQFKSLSSLNSINIYRLDKSAITDTNVDGRVLVKTVDVLNVVEESEGSYYIDVDLTNDYVIGDYIDVWNITYDDPNPLNCPTDKEFTFKVYSDLWFSSEKPFVYDFDFTFRPNRIVKGTKQYLIVQVHPNVPNATQLEEYYVNLGIVPDMKVYMSTAGQCPSCPQTDGPDMIIEDESATFKEMLFAYYLIDTDDIDDGMYDIWFKMDLGECRYVSPKFQIQIYS